MDDAIDKGNVGKLASGLLSSGREIAKRCLAYFQQQNHTIRPPQVARSLARSVHVFLVR